MEVYWWWWGYLKCTWLGTWKGWGVPWSPDLSKRISVKAGRRSHTDSGWGASKGWGKVKEPAQREERTRG